MHYVNHGMNENKENSTARDCTVQELKFLDWAESLVRAHRRHNQLIVAEKLKQMAHMPNGLQPQAGRRGSC